MDCGDKVTVLLASKIKEVHARVGNVMKELVPMVHGSGGGKAGMAMGPIVNCSGLKFRNPFEEPGTRV